MAEDDTFRIDVDARPLSDALASLTRLSERFGATLTGALKSAAVSGRALEDVLRRIALSLASMALEQGLAPLRGLAGALFSGLLRGLSGIIPFARGGVVPFAAGGVVSAPTYFPLGGRVGLMGEAGPEAVLPLRRGADGTLGVAAATGGPPVSITFNVTTPDAPSFRKSEAQIAGMLTRAVSRGTRTL